MGNEGCTKTDAISFTDRGETFEEKSHSVNSNRWEKSILQHKRQQRKLCVRSLLLLYIYGFDFYLLCVVGCVRQHGGHMKHNLIVLVACVEGVCPC